MIRNNQAKRVYEDDLNRATIDAANTNWEEDVGRPISPTAKGRARRFTNDTEADQEFQEDLESARQRAEETDWRIIKPLIQPNSLSV
jgi:hypothetical protein